MPTSSCVSENVALLEEDERPGNNQKKIIGKKFTLAFQFAALFAPINCQLSDRYARSSK